MRTLLTFLILAGQSWGALAFVNATKKLGNNTDVVTDALSVTQNNLLFAYASHDGACGTITYTVSYTGSYSLTGGTQTSNTYNCGQAFYGIAAATNASTVFTFHCSATCSSDLLIVVQISGNATTSYLDQSGTGSNTSGTAIQLSASITTDTADEIILIGGHNYAGYGGIGADTGYTLDTNANYSGVAGVAYKILTATETSTPKLPISTTTYGVCGAMSFRASSGGGATAARRRILQ